ncbi:hypothetical protein IEQ34_014245 [Dendrobium chrysotoxum]|uniref:Uncharacterized protein n=1 Tax=Dendrobium chrysotoxum TaxID=161865 RepID=A0AAV7GL42_DENCH|nr:hypothetical protein IEQ34_014245 [Dendrobium chrysotoxum]
MKTTRRLARERTTRRYSSDPLRTLKYFSIVEVFTKEEKASEDDECCILAFDPIDSLTPTSITVLTWRITISLNQERKRKSSYSQNVTSAIATYATKLLPGYFGRQTLLVIFTKNYSVRMLNAVWRPIRMNHFGTVNNFFHFHTSDKEENGENFRFFIRISLQNREQNFLTKSKTIHSLPTAQTTLMWS